MKIIATSNFNNDAIADILIAENVNSNYAQFLADEYS